MSGEYISKDRKHLLVKLVSTDQELLRAKFTATSKESQRRWSAIADQLNDIPGQSLEWTQWRLIWRNLHSAARQAAIAKHIKGTGCGSPNCCLNQVIIPTDLISAPTILTIVSTVPTDMAIIPTISTAVPTDPIETIEHTVPTIEFTIPTIAPADPAIESTIQIFVPTDSTIVSTIPTIIPTNPSIPTTESTIPTTDLTDPSIEPTLPNIEATIPTIILTESTSVLKFPTPTKSKYVARAGKHRASRWRPIQPSQSLSAPDILAARANADMKQQYYSTKLNYKRQQLDRLDRMTVAIEMLAASLTPVPN